MTSRFALLAVLAATGAVAAPVPYTPPTVGSGNTAIADPGVARPATTPCRVQLFTDQPFADFSPKFFSYAPPAACPGPWQKVVLEADYSVEAGRQFDRTATLWIGGVNVYFGTTAEPSATVPRAWHIERDLTEYSALLRSASTGRAELGNLVNTTYTSTLFGSADLAFYPANDEDPGASKSADVVLALSGSPTGGTVALFDPSMQLAATFVLPTNIEKAFLDVVLQHQGANDEFWYTCVPNDLTGALASCAGTAFREGQLSIDGQPAGVVPIFPWIFTGGIDPYFWRPIPAPQALNFIPYRVDVTPFAGVLSDGQPHQFAINVTNDSNYFQTTATLLLYLDHDATQVTGEVSENTIGAPAPAVTPALTTSADGTVSGTVSTTSSRKFVLSGWAQTSHGRVETEISQQIDFSNVQQFVSPTSAPVAFVQNIVQSTSILSTTRVRGGDDDGRESSTRMSWPLEVDLTIPPAASFTQVGRVRQAYHRVDSDGDKKSVVFNSGEWADTYPTKVGQSGSQRYFSSGPDGRCYSRALTAAAGLLTAIVDGEGCDDHGR
jgi:hypothetical protein